MKPYRWSYIWGCNGLAFDPHSHSEKEEGRENRERVWHPIFFVRKYGKWFVQGLVINTVRSEKQGKHPGLLSSYTWRLLPVWLGNPKNLNRRFRYFNGGEEKGPEEEWGLESPREEGQEDKEGTPGQFPCFSHYDPIITARTSDPGASPPSSTLLTPRSIPCPIPRQDPASNSQTPQFKGIPTRLQAAGSLPALQGQELLPSVATATTRVLHSLASRAMIGEGKRP